MTLDLLMTFQMYNTQGKICTRINKLTCTEMRGTCSAGDVAKGIRSKSMEREEMFTEKSDKELYSK